MSKLNQKLAIALDQPPGELAFLEALPDKAQTMLLADIEAARDAHKRQIVARLEEALEHIPRLLRGPIKKIFGV